MVLLTFCNTVYATTYVSGYRKSNGTYVKGYHRSTSDYTKRNNYSSRGNRNPYTGAKGYKNPNPRRYDVNKNYWR